MNKIIIFTVLLFGLVYGLSNPSGFFSSGDKASLISLINKAQSKDGSFIGLKNTYYAVNALHNLGEKTPNKDKVCEFVNSALKSFNSEDIFFHTALVNILSCDAKVNDKVDTALKSSLEGANSLRDLSFAVRAAVALRGASRTKVSDSVITRGVSKLLDLADEDGLFRADVNGDGSFSGTGAALNALAEYYSTIPGIEEDITEKIEAALNNAKNIFEQDAVREDENGITISDVDAAELPIKTTSQIFTGIANVARVTKFKFPLTQNQVYGIAEFLIGNKAAATVEVANFLVEGLKAVANNGFYNPVVFTLDSQAFQSSEKTVSASVTNVFGETITDCTVRLVSLTAEGKKPVAQNVALTKKEKQFELSVGNLLLQPGVYSARFSVERKGVDSESVQKVKVLGKIQLVDVRIAAAPQGSDFSEGTVIKAAYPGKPQSLSASSTDRLLVELKVVSEGEPTTNILLQQVFATFHAGKNSVTIPLKHVAKQYSARISVVNDLLPYLTTGNVEQQNVTVTLTVADGWVGNPIQWDVANLVLPGNFQSVSDLFAPKPEIQHKFRAPEKRAPSFIADLFTLATLAPLGVLLLGWTLNGALGTLLNPIGRRGIWGLIFQGTIGVVILTYIQFWLAGNMVSTLTYLLGLFTIAYVGATRAFAN